MVVFGHHTTLSVRFGTQWLLSRGIRRVTPWSSWSASAAAGMALVYICTGITHFVEPQRSGLAAIVPPFIPEPDLVITLSGISEFAPAAGLLIPRTRRLAAVASAIMLVALFPANIIAAAGVDNPAVPNTALVPRVLLQVVSLGFSLAPLLRRKAEPRRRQISEIVETYAK